MSSIMLKALRQLKAKGVDFSPQTSTDAPPVTGDTAESPSERTIVASGVSAESDGGTGDPAVDPSITVLVGEHPNAYKSVEINSRIEDTWQKLALLVESDTEPRQDSPTPYSTMPHSTQPMTTQDDSDDAARTLVIDEPELIDGGSHRQATTEPQVIGGETQTFPVRIDREQEVVDLGAGDTLGADEDLHVEDQALPDSPSADRPPGATLVMSDREMPTGHSDFELKKNESPKVPDEVRAEDTPDLEKQGNPGQRVIPTALDVTQELTIDLVPNSATVPVNPGPRSTIPLSDIGLPSLRNDTELEFRDGQPKPNVDEDTAEAVKPALDDANQAPEQTNPLGLDGATETGNTGDKGPPNTTLIVDDVEKLASLTRVDGERPSWRAIDAGEVRSDTYEGHDGAPTIGMETETGTAPASQDVLSQRAASTERFTIRDVGSFGPLADEAERVPAADSPANVQLSGFDDSHELDSLPARDAMPPVASATEPAADVLAGEFHAFFDEAHDEASSVLPLKNEEIARYGDRPYDAMAADAPVAEETATTAPAVPDAEGPSSRDTPHLSHSEAKTEFLHFIQDRLADERVRSQYRDLQENIRAAVRQGESAVIALIGADEEEHVTETTACLANMFAEDEAGEVLAVDANFPGRSLSKRLGYVDLPGLADVCEGIETWHEAVVEKALAEKVSVLPGGGWLTPTKTTADVISPLLAEWKERFELVIVDAGNVDSMLANAVCKTADATYLLVRLGQTERQQAEKAAAKLRDGGAKLSGCIVTNVPQDRIANDVDGTTDARRHS